VRGRLVDVVNAPGVTADAFKIDGTVTLGANNPLFGESGTVNEIFEPGETWRFIVTNVLFPANVPPTLITVRVGVRGAARAHAARTAAGRRVEVLAVSSPAAPSASARHAVSSWI
jgi:hypothetical protein